MKFKEYKDKFKTPQLKLERDTPSISRAQRLTTLLEHDARFAHLPNFANRLKALSPAPTKIDTALSMVNVKGRGARPEAALIAAALNTFTEKDFSDPVKRANYRTLRRMQLQSPKVTTAGGGQKKVSPTGGDKRRYNPTGKAFAVHRSGMLARVLTNPVMSSTWVQVFKNPGSVIPCIQRKSRREVMFAKGHGGRGYRVKHRRSWATGIPC